MNRLHDVLAQLLPGEAVPKNSVTVAAQLLRRVRSTSGVTRTRRRVASDLISDPRHRDRSIASLEQRTNEAVAASRTALVDLFGIGPVLAAKIVGHVGDVTRQEENQYLSVPLEVARELPEDIQRLMGYRLGAFALGYVDDVRDAIEVLRPSTDRPTTSLFANR